MLHSPAISRYLVVILNGTKNPYRGAVAQDIRDAIIKTRAQKGVPATYWNQAEQEIRLKEAYKKWSRHGGVWSAVAAKVKRSHSSPMCSLKWKTRSILSNWGMLRKDALRVYKTKSDQMEAVSRDVTSSGIHFNDHFLVGWRISSLWATITSSVETFVLHSAIQIYVKRDHF